MARGAFRHKVAYELIPLSLLDREAVGNGMRAFRKLALKRGMATSRKSASGKLGDSPGRMSPRLRMTVLGLDTRSCQTREVRPQLVRVLVAEAKRNGATMQHKNGLTWKTPALVPLLP